MATVTDVRVMLDGKWIPARDYQIDAYNQFNSSNNQRKPFHYNKNGYIFTILDELPMGTYLIRENGSKMPICDFADLKILVDGIWNEPRQYQQEAMLSTIYDKKDVKNFCTRETETKYLLTYPSQYNFLNHGRKNLAFTMCKLNMPDVGHILCQLNSNNTVYICSFGHIPIRILEQIDIELQKTDNTIKLKPVKRKLELLTQSTLLPPPLPPPNDSKIETRFVRKSIPHGNWFEKAFGFTETNYNDTKTQLLKLYENGQINGINVGVFVLLNTTELQNTLIKKTHKGNVVIQNIVGDVRNLHSNVGVFQVASQLNALEMVNPHVTPEAGITNYINDRTQGPICAMCAPAALAYRNYLHNDGQTAHKQIDMSSNLLKYLKTVDNEIDWKVQNGYLFLSDKNMLDKINSVLENKNVYENAKNSIFAGVHWDVGVYPCDKINHLVTQVYCSGLPISYHKGSLNNNKHWTKLSELFLDAYYEITLLTACINNQKNNTNYPVYLTQIGGGVFGMDKSHIVKAIIKASKIIEQFGHNLDIKIVHYGSIDHFYDSCN